MGVKNSVIKLLGGIPKQSHENIVFGSARKMDLVNGKIVVDSSTPATKKVTPKIGRIPKIDLEVDYLSDPIVFNSINKTVQIIMSAGWTLIGDDKSVNFYDKWFDGVGSRGGETEWDEILRMNFKHQMVFGDAWNEIIPAKGDNNKPVDLEVIDPKGMDYAKDKNEEIVLNEFMDPIGYVQTLPLDTIGSVEQKYSPPDKLQLDSNQIFLPPDKVAHYKLNTIGDRFYGVGLIEPAHNSLRRKQVIEKSLANWMKRFGFPKVIVEFGDATHNPTEQQIQRGIETIKKMDEMGVIGTYYWVKVRHENVTSPDRLLESLKYWLNQIITVGGLPEALASGKADTTNRATLSRLEALAKLTMKDTVRGTIRTIEKKIIEPIARANKGINPVRIKWGEIAIEELNDKSKRLQRYVDVGLLVPDPELEKLIRKIEDLPEREIRESIDSNNDKARKD